MAGGSGTGGRRGARSRARVSPPASTTRSTSAVLKARALAALDELTDTIGPRAIPPAPGRERDRGDFEDLDLTEPDDIELWMAGELRDWQLAIGADTLGQLASILGAELAVAKDRRAAIKNDLRSEGYLDGQINILETILEQVNRAIEARRNRIGEAVKRDG